jgi:hypothetical protein
LSAVDGTSGFERLPAGDVGGLYQFDRLPSIRQERLVEVVVTPSDGARPRDSVKKIAPSSVFPG